MSHSSENLISKQVKSILRLTANRLKIRESEMASLNKQKREKQSQLKNAEDSITKHQNDLLQFKNDSNAFLNNGGLIPKNFISHRDTEIKVFESKISQAIKAKEKIIVEIKALDIKINQIQIQINTEAKREKKFEYLQDLQHN